MKNAKLLVVALIVAAILSVSAVGAAEISLNATSSDPTQVPHEQVVSVAEPTSVQEVETIDLESSDDEGIDINNEIKLDSDELRSTNFKESLSRNDDSILGVSFDENILSAPIVNGSYIYPSGQTFQDIRDCIDIAKDGNIIDLGGNTYRGTYTFFNVKNNITIINGILNPSADAKAGMGFTNCNLINITFQNFYYVNGLSWPINFNKAVLTNVSFINMSFPVAFGTGEDSKFEGCKFINLTSRYPFDESNYEWGAMLILYTSEVNNSLFYNCTTNRHSGAICVAGRTGGSKPGNIVNITNSNFINCRAGVGGAIYVHGTNTDANYHSNIINCNFTNCSATAWGGAIGSSQNYLNVEDCNFINNTAKKGAAYMVGGIHGTALDGHSEQGHYNTMKNCYFFNNIGSEEGGAVHMTGDYNSAIDCVFDDNFAINGTGAAIYVKGNHSTIHNSNFTNHEAEMGTVYVEGNYLNCTDSYFEGNVASHGGSGIYVEGDYTLINNTLFENNNASRHGGAVHSIGDYARILNSQFYYNNAIPSLDNPDYGLGGAVFIDGDHNEISFSQFKYNTARNGSAIYNRGDNLTLIDDTFDHNQAWSYLLFTESKPQESYWREDLETLVNVTLEGGDNLINAIYNDRTVEHITFHNVTYYINPTQLYPTGKRTTGPDDIHPVDGVEKSEGGKYLYQDSREDNQVIKVNITYDGKKVYEYEGKTDMYGNVLLSIKKEDLADGQYRVGTYNVFASHPDDAIYTAIENTTLFKVNPHVDVSVTKTSDKDVYFVGENAIFTIRVYGVGTNATNVKVRDILPKSLEFVSAVADQGEYDSVNNVWNVGDLPHDNSRILYLTVRTTEIGTFDNVVNVTCSEQDWNMSNNVDNKTIHVDLYYTKEASVEKTFVGKFIEYYIKVYNLGSTDYREVVRVSDLLPEGIVYAGNYTVENATLIQYTGSSNAQIWEITDIPAKKYALITIKALAIKEGIWNNTVKVWDYPPVNATVNVSINADLEVIKVVSDKTPEYGDEITWTVTVTNHGPNDAEGVYVEDLLPYGLIYVSDDSNGAYANGKWVIGDLKAGGEAVINIKTIVDIVEATITNIAVVNSTTPDDNESNNKDNDTITVGPSCDLEITKTVNNSNPKKDEIVTWTIIVYNHGPSRATGVYVRDLLPEGVTYLSDDSGGDYKNGVWDIGELEKHGEAVIKIETLVTLSNKTITNVAVVNSTTPDTNESNNKDNDTIEVDPVTDLAIEKIVSNHTPRMGDIIIWTVTVTNNGPDAAVNAVMRDVIPDGLIFVRSDGNYANNVWTIGDLANGSSATLRIWTQVDVTAAVITNVANVTSDTPESDLTNNNDSATIDVGHEADLAVVKIVSNHTPRMGDIIIWTVSVTNNGPDGAVDVIVTDVLPAGLIYIKDDSNGKYKNNVWTIGTLNNKETVTLEITTEVAISNANITNVAVVTSDTYDPNETNNKDNDTIEVPPLADLAIEKIVSNHTPKMGDIIIWTVSVTNYGPDTAVNTVVNDVLPAGLIFVRSDGNYANNVWTIGDLANGSSATLRIWTQVDVTAAVITNVAVVTSDTPDSDLTNNNDSATIDVDHEADLAVVKIVSNHTPKMGDIIIWTVSVTNYGPDRAVDVIVTDVLPAGLIYIKDDSNGKYKNNVWTIGTLNNKETVTLEITTEVAISNANITNVAVVTSDTYDPNETNNKDNDTIEVPPVADLAIEKIVSNHTPKMGDIIIWTVSVTNYGPDTAVNTVVNDVLPAGLIFVRSDGNYANNVWTIGDLANGSSATLRIWTQVDVTAAVITNVANVTSDTPDSDLSNNNDSETIDVGHEADLEVIKIVSNPTPNKGDNITWTVIVINNGPDRAVDVIVTDVLPEGLIYINDNSGGRYKNNVWTIGDLENNEIVTLEITTEVTISNANITNVVVVTSDTYDPNETNNKDNDTIEVPPMADVEITKVVSNHKPHNGDEITWTITVVNHGPDDAVNVVVSDDLPAGLIYVSDDGNGAYDSKTGLWDVGDLHRGRGLVLNIVTKVDVSNTNITNVAVVTSDTYDSNETNNKDNDTVEIKPIVDLAIKKSVNNHTPKMGDIIIWTVSVTNYGPDTAVNTVVNDVLPAGLIFVRSDGNYANNVWTIGDLANGSSATLRIWTQVDVTAAVITNVANVTSDTPDSDLTNNNDSETIDVGHEADLEVKKIVSNPTPNKGDIITWTIIVINHGPDNAVDVAVTDVLPEGLIYIKDDSNGKYKNNVWNIGTLESKTFTALQITTEVAISNANITNVAVVTSDTHDPNETNNKDNDTIEVPPAADLEIAKVASVSQAYYGDNVNWTIVVFNKGPDAAVNVIVDDVLPDGLIYVSDDGEGAYDSASGKWTVGNLSVGGWAALNIVSKVAVYNTNITNVAVVTSDTYDPNETNNKDNDTVETKPLTDLSIVKTSDKDEYFVGDIAVWTVTIHNAANGTDATNIYVDDFFPGDYFEIISWTVSKGTFEKWIGNEYMWKIASMGNGTDATLTIVSRAKAPRGEITNFVQTFCDEDEWDYENNLDKKSVDVVDIPNPIKSVDNPEPYYNDEIVYDLTIINTGNTVYTNYLTVVDSLPAGLEFVGVDSASGADVVSFDESTLTWVLTNIDYKAPAVITVRVKVSDVGSLTNNLTVVGPDGTTKTVNCTVDVPFADLEVVKFVSNATVHKGDAVIWTIVVTNKGPDVAEGVYVKDVLPRGLIFVGADGDYDPVTGIWTVGDLISGESRSLAIGTVANITNANVTNVAVVNSTTHDPDLTNNKANNTTSVPPEADIEVVKEVDASESVKDQIVVWTITMSNKGPDGAENVLVKDNLPDTLIFISADGDYDPATGIWTIDYLASGEVRVLHIITKVNTTNEVIVNNVTVTSGTYDPDMENNKANNTTKVGPLADLEIVKIVSDSTPHKGDVITWTIVVMNIGPDMAEDVTVSDKLPAGLIFISADGDYDPATGIWTVGTLNNGEFKSLVITTIVNITNANVTNVAVVNSTTPDSNETNNRDNDTAEIEPEADIAVIKYVSNPNPVQGDVITWTVVVTNNGPDVAEDVSVAEHLPAGLKLISARGSKGTYENGIWTVGTLNNGDVEILVLTTEVTASKGIIENIVVATGSTYDPNETNNRDNESVVPEPLNLSADLEVIKTANVEKVKVGDKIVWTITVINHGPGVAKNVRVADVSMGDIEYVSSGASKGLFDPVSGIWIIGDMENGESAVLTLEFKALSAGTVINAAVVVSDTPDPNEDNNKDKSVVSVEPVSPAPAAAKSPVSEAPATMHATGNPIVMVLLALLAVVGVTLRRKD